MFGSDYNKKGVAVSYTVSITLHIIVLLLFLFFQNKHRKALADYTLTEINIIEEVPDQQQPKPVQIEKPKSMLDILKQVIPIKQKASIEIAKPKTLEIEKPKIDLKKPQALELSKVDDKLKPSVKAIDLDNEIGQKKISPAMMKQQIELQKQQKLAAAPSKLDLSKASTSPKSSFLPVERPAISADAVQRGSALKASALKLGKPTPEPQKKAQEEQIVIKKEKGAALLLTGQIENRPIRRKFVPAYPRWAQEQGIEAQVAIYFVVRPDGTVKENAYVSRGSGYPELDQLALEAILKFEFEPLPSSERQEDQSGTAIFKYQLAR